MQRPTTELAIDSVGPTADDKKKGQYAWPPVEKRKYIGSRSKRVDGPQKVQGRAKYTYDLNRPGMLYGAIVRSQYAHARIKSIDVSAAQAMPGVKAIVILQGPGAERPSSEVHWAGDEIVALAAVDERAARDAMKAVKIEYEPLPHLVLDTQEPPKEIPPDNSPLAQGDIQDMLVNQVPNNQVVQAIQKRGITFEATDEFLARAKGAGAPQPVLDAMKAAPRKPAENKPPSWYKPSAESVKGDPDKAFQEADAVSEGLYGASVITHCCLETHGAISEWTDDSHVLAYVSTQNVSGIPDQLAGPLGISAANVRVHQDHIGGGFGSKFGIDRWGIATALLSKKAGGKPVKIMLDRAEELKVAGCRPSAYARVKVGAKKDGTLTAWDAFGWGTGGPGGGGAPPIPYLLNNTLPNQRNRWTAVVNNIGPARAWRAPNHPQAAVITMGALEDLAAKLGMNPLDFFRKNVDLTGPRADVYREEMTIAEQLMGWNAHWHPRGDKSAGAIKRGLGMSLHTWGGRGHASECDLLIHPDGSIEMRMGTQDLGTGTRTCIMAVAADTLGVPLESIKLMIGDTEYPKSGGSGGSTTIGGVSSSTRRAAVDARDALFAKVAPALGATPDQLEAVNGQIRVAGTPTKALSWKDACAKIGAVPISAHGKNPDTSRPPDLTNAGVGGVQMADVSVDVETGVVKVNKMVAVQDCGLIIDMRTAESQVLGALIMGVSYALYEEKVMDPTTGIMLNPNMEFYRLAGLGDIPELVVHMMQNKYDERGVIGLGEPPVVSPGAAISNAVANAIGVRVPFLPLTPPRVLAALESSGGAA